MNNFDWDQTVAFDGRCYRHSLTIPTVLSYREIYSVVGTVVLTSSNYISLCRTTFSETIFGDSDEYTVRISEFDFGVILRALKRAGVINIKNTRIYLTKEGQDFLNDITDIGIDFFAQKRAYAQAIIESNEKGD